jgi:undecaprenyl-diphosphatase
MNPIVFILLFITCALLLMLERGGAPLTLRLSFRGDVKRETFFLQQWGQSVATPICAIAIMQLDPRPLNERFEIAFALVTIVCAAAIACFICKRLLGRVRPNRPNAGKFLGPNFGNDSAVHSFPSSHAACAIASSVFLSAQYPSAATLFWGLGIMAALLRYLLDAHWPSDVIAGAAIGYAAALIGMGLFHIV